VTDAPRVISSDARLALEQFGLVRGLAVLAGDLSSLAPYTAAAGWPTVDTADGLGAALTHAETDEDTPFLVVLLATGEVIGDCGWKGGAGPDGRAEIGYGLAVSARGQGLGTELVRTLTGWALAQPGCTSVVADVLADNLPSRRALERAGFAVDRVDGGDVWYVYPPT
jgi:RimJ/RimL family protein N-acetyltransferase